MELRPGLNARLDVLKDPLVQASGNSSPTLTLNVVADFAVTGSGLARGGFSSALQQVGGISGALVGDLAGRCRPQHTGRGRSQPERTGACRDRCRPGASSSAISSQACIGSASNPTTCRSNSPRAGLRETSKCARAPLPAWTSGSNCDLAARVALKATATSWELKVAIVDTDGQLVTEVGPSASGFYRADNLKPGTYRIELRQAATGAPVAARSLTLTNRFIFAQDFRRNPDPESEPAVPGKQGP